MVERTHNNNYTWSCTFTAICWNFLHNTELGIGDRLNQVCAQVESAMLHACWRLFFVEWLLFNTNSAIFQLYHGEIKLIFNEMMTRSALY